MLENVVLRAAVTGDIPSLVSLNRKWQKAVLDGDTGRGFLSGEIAEDAFSLIVKNSEIAIAQNDTGQIVAYQLISNTSNSNILAIHGGLVKTIIEKGLLPQGSNVAIGVQICVDIPYQGTGLKTKILEQLCKLATGKYDFLFSTVGKENERSYKAHKSDGWEIIYETETHYCILYRL
ncbi:MAG: hypothetical protein K0Q79_372 [Flavipsychrobacter sp.]|jgi:hypothetical protein|nr:hypothetical protein [Flavipsychrobacter sp.]